MSAQFAIVEPRRIKATHRRRRKVAAGPIVQRYYDPQVGRFLSVDPAGAGFNLYNYANNNPYKFTDPDGRTPDRAGIARVMGDIGRAMQEALAPLAPYAADLVETIDQNSYAFGPGPGGLEHMAAVPLLAVLREAQVTKNAVQGANAELKVAGDLVAEGKTILGSHASAQTAEGKRVIDHLISDASGTISAVEVKSGGATRSAAQVAKDTAMATTGAKLVGKNVPAELRGTTIKIETEVRKVE